MAALIRYLMGKPEAGPARNAIEEAIYAKSVSAADDEYKMKQAFLEHNLRGPVPKTAAELSLAINQKKRVPPDVSDAAYRPQDTDLKWHDDEAEEMLRQIYEVKAPPLRGPNIDKLTAALVQPEEPERDEAWEADDILDRQYKRDRPSSRGNRIDEVGTIVERQKDEKKAAKKRKRSKVNWAPKKRRPWMKRVYNANRIVASAQVTWDWPSVGDQEGKVCVVRNYWDNKLKTFYLVEWEGGEKTWEPPANILGEELLSDFKTACAATDATTGLIPQWYYRSGHYGLDGWKPYSQHDSQLAENEYRAYLAAKEIVGPDQPLFDAQWQKWHWPASVRFVRPVRMGPKNFEYKFNFDKFAQCNTETSCLRHLQRRISLPATVAAAAK